MIKKIFLLLMIIVVTMPSFVIDLSALRVEASGYEVVRHHLSGNPMKVTGNIPVHEIIDIDGSKYWVGSGGGLLHVGTEYYMHPGVMRHDYLNETPSHNYEAGQPKGPVEDRFAEIEEMVIEKGRSRPDRNGWSGWVKFCGPDGTWDIGREERFNTTDSNPEREYTVTAAEWESYFERYPEYNPSQAPSETNLILAIDHAIVDYVYTYGSTGSPDPAMNKELDQYNQSIFYDASEDKYTDQIGVVNDGSHNIAQKIECDEGDELAYYNDQDFTFYPKFTIPETPTTTTDQCDPTTTNCCLDPAWGAANPDQALIDCPPPGEVCDPLTEDCCLDLA